MHRSNRTDGFYESLGYSCVLGMLIACSGSEATDASAKPTPLDTTSDAGTPNETPTAAPITNQRQLRIDDQPYLMLGVCWNPVPLGAVHPAGLDYAGSASQDIALMAELGINTVRTYETLTNRDVLDQLFAAGITVINSVYQWGGNEPAVVTARVRELKDHPAILMWSLGNEWNYNGLYIDLSHEESLARINAAAALVRAEDPTHPIATIYGELPSAETLAAMPNIDIWGLNSYRGLSFGDLFESWETRSPKPMFVAEYGADSYNANLNRYDPESQNQAVQALTQEIVTQASARNSEGVAIGGTIFEWADEWWKDSTGSPTEQDVGGIAPGGGPFPDSTFNEEWWGLVEIDRTPRPAFAALQQVFQAAQL